MLISECFPLCVFVPLIFSFFSLFLCCDERKKKPGIVCPGRYGLVSRGGRLVLLVICLVLFSIEDSASIILWIQNMTYTTPLAYCFGCFLHIRLPHLPLFPLLWRVLIYGNQSFQIRLFRVERETTTRTKNDWKKKWIHWIFCFRLGECVVQYIDATEMLFNLLAVARTQNILKDAIGENKELWLIYIYTWLQMLHTPHSLKMLILLNTLLSNCCFFLSFLRSRSISLLLSREQYVLYNSLLLIYIYMYREIPRLISFILSFASVGKTKRKK